MAASEELALVVIVSVKAGKGETFLKLSEEAYDRFWPKEPGCLQFQIHRNIDGVQDGEERFALVERYTSKKALDEHESTESYATLFKQVTDQDVLAGPPIRFLGNPIFGTRDRASNA